MERIQYIVQRATNLKKSGVYSGTVCEYVFDDVEQSILEQYGLQVRKRLCKKYPSYIFWSVNDESK